MYQLEDTLVNTEFIEDHITPEDIFEYYLYPVNFAVKYTNPFREDRHPDCNYYISKSGILYFVDNARDKKHYNCYQVVMEHYKCSYHEALKHIYKDMIKGKEAIVREITHEKKKRAKDKISLKVKVKPFTKKELDFWCIGGLNVTEQELKENGIYSVETLWENGVVYDNLNFVFVYIQDGKIIQVYFPRRPKGEKRFSNNTGFVFSNVNKVKDDKSIFILTKANKCRFYLNKFGIPSEYNVNETVLLDRAVFERLTKEYDVIYSLFDNDRQGKHAAWRHRKEYGITPLFIPEELGKDFSEYVEKVGYQEVIDTIEDLKNSL